MTTETIVGMDTSRGDAARIMNQFVKTKWIAVEAALYRGKWFDYRFLNPVQATYLYAHEFVKAYKRAFSTNIESARAAHVKPLDIDKLFNIPDDADDKTIKKLKMRTSGIWKGRMIADAMGMPYSVYLELAFHWTLRYWQQSHLPRPQQLYSDLVTDRAAIGWEARCKDEFFYSTLPQYKNGAYYETLAVIEQNPRLAGTALESQNAHHEWLMAQCEDRVNGHAILAQMVFHDEVLPVEKVKSRLDENGFDRFLSFAESDPVIERYN